VGRAVVDAETESIAQQAIEAAFIVHRALGPGLLESVYEHCLAAELAAMGVQYERQLGLPVRYRHLALEAGYRLDFLVSGRVILEIKAVEALAPVHVAQLLTYMRLSDVKLGFLLNFNVAMLKDGLRRLVL
jgi:GxxExxY protein